MRAWITAVAWVIAVAARLAAQADGVPVLTWDQPAASLGDVKALTFRLYRDGSTYAVPLTGVICTAPTRDSPPNTYPCSATFPASTPGQLHTLIVTASNAKGEGPGSNVLRFRLAMARTP